MPWSLGSFSRVYGATGWQSDLASSIFILASRHDTHDQDMANGVNACLTRDNQAKPTASFLPSTNNAIDLGSASFIWRRIYGLLYSDLIHYDTTPAEIAALITPKNYAEAAYRWPRYDAKGNGATSDVTAATDANAAATGREQFAPALTGTYRMATALSESGNVVVTGEGMLNGVPKTTVEFSATPGVGVGQWDFSGGTSYAALKNLHVAHSSQVAAVANGVGIKLASAAFSKLDNVYVEYFDVGLSISSHFYYRSLRDFFSLNNYTAALKITGSLWNGKPVFGGTFSRTVNGYGIDANGIGSHIALYSTYRELNAGGALNLQGAFIHLDIGGYNEQNGALGGAVATDGYFPNIYPHLTAHHVGMGVYSDVSGNQALPRLRGTLTSYVLVGYKWFTDNSHAPIRVDDLRGYQPSTFIGCEYGTEYLTTVGINEQAAAVIIDSKHPAVYFSPGVPTDANVHIGSVWINKTASSKNVLAWRGTTPGRLTPVAITTTATTTAGSAVVTINVSNNAELVVGEYIKIAGTNFASGDAYAMIIECKSNATIVLNKTADSSVAGAAISYNQAVLQTIPANNDTVTSFNLSTTSGVSLQVLQFAMATTEKATVTIDGVMASTAADDLCTSKLSKVVFSNNAGTITATAATDFGTVNAAGGAVAYTITGGSSGNNARIFVTQTTGSTRVFGFRATVVISQSTPSIT